MTPARGPAGERPPITTEPHACTKSRPDAQWLPALAPKEIRSRCRSEPHDDTRRGERIAEPLAQCIAGGWGREIKDPADETGMREIRRECGGFGGVQVDEKSFRQSKRRPRRFGHLPKHLPPCRAVGEIEFDPSYPAGRGFTEEPAAFASDDRRQIYLDPSQSAREREAIGPRVQSGGEVDHQVGAVTHLVQDETVDQARTDRDGRNELPAERKRCREPSTARAGEPARKGIDNERPRSPRFPGARGCRQQRRIGNAFQHAENVPKWT